LVAAIFFGLSGIIWAEEKKPDDTVDYTVFTAKVSFRESGY
jgi:hypothetical protein